MEPRQPLFLKTYGKQRRQLSAWITVENHKQAFDSTASTDGDIAAFEPTKPPTKRAKRTHVAVTVGKAAQPAKKKAMLRLTKKRCDEENVNSEASIASRVKRVASPPHPQASQQSKTTRGKKTSVSRGRTVRPAKRKARLHVTENSSNEENISWPSPPLPRPTHPSKTTRESRLVSAAGVLNRQKGRQAPETSESEEHLMSATKCHRKSVLTKRDSEVQLRSVGRFVTRRRRGAAVVSKLPKSIVSTLNSSDDFSSSSNVRPVKRRKILLSSAENSINAAGTLSFVTNPLQELSFNESADHSLGPYPKNPIFCSTPSAGSFSKHPHLKPFPISVKSSTPPSMTVSRNGVLSPFQGDTNSPGQLVSPLHAAPPNKLQPHLGNQEAHLHHYEEQSGDLFMEYTSTNKRIRFSDEAKGHSDDSKTKDGGELPSLLLLSTDGDRSSDFASAAGGLDWLIEALKEKCLTEFCTVQLQRLDSLSLTQLCSQTLYSSCVELSSSDHSQQTNGHPLSLDSSHTASIDHHLSVTNSKPRDYLQFGNSLRSPGQMASVNCMQSINDSTHHIEKSVEFIMEKQLPVRSLQTLFTEEKTVALKEKCRSRKCKVQLIKLSSSQLKSLTKHRTATGNDQAHNSDNREELTCSGGTAEGMMVCVRQPTNTSSRLAQTQSSDPTDKHHESDSTLSGKKQSSSSSEDRISPDEETVKRPCNIRPKRKKMSPVPKGKKRRRTSTDRPGTSRKACVSGLNVSRWKNKGRSCKGSWAGNAKALDSSINDLITTKHKQPQELDTVRNFSTPVRATSLNLSTLLADFTPNTHTWSRLKAALSVHRKVLLTPSSLHLAGSPATAALADVSQDLFATPLRTLLPKHLHLQLHHNSSVVCEDAELSDAEKVYAECGQKQPLPWEECILPHRRRRCVKIGEGTFGEVFSTTNPSGDTVALKIIPLEGSEKVNGEDQKTFAEILHEIIISKELSSLKEKQQNQTHSFIGLNDLHCVRGCYPPEFLKAWDKYDQQNGSENDRPDFFEKDQLFLILEFEFGGVDLENSNGTLISILVAKSILHQVTAALAVAEQELHFEHRDLHWGNVLVKTTKQKMGSFLLNGAAHSVETKGVLVRIIDYSLSRLEIDDLTVSCDISKDEELFMGQGDYQFEIYRLMRQENGNNWSDFHPHTNVLWLHYLCSKLQSMKYLRRVGGAKNMRKQLTSFYDNVLQYSSATEVLLNCPMFQ